MPPPYSRSSTRRRRSARPRRRPLRAPPRLLRDLAERLDRDLAPGVAPGRDGAAVDQGEGAEDAVDRHQRLCGPTTSSREVQPSSSGSKAPSRRGAGCGSARRALGQVDEPVLALDQLRAIAAEPGAGVAQRQAGPAGEVAVVGRAVAGEVAAGQLGQRRVAVDRLAAARASRGRARRRAACRPSARARRSRAGRRGKAGGSGLALGAHAGGVEALAQLVPGQRPLLGERPLDRLIAALRRRLETPSWRRRRVSWSAAAAWSAPAAAGSPRCAPGAGCRG